MKKKENGRKAGRKKRQTLSLADNKVLARNCVFSNKQTNASACRCYASHTVIVTASPMPESQDAARVDPRDSIFS